MKIDYDPVTCEICGLHKPVYTFEYISQQFACKKCIKGFVEQ